jgi:hypothetical protein
MREDDNKYELKKVLTELDTAKKQRHQAFEELSIWMSQMALPDKHLMPSEIRKKLDEAITKYTEACHKEESLEEIKEGRE